MSWPSFIMNGLQKVRPPMEFQPTAGAIATVMTPAQQVDKVQDLLLWADKPWRFVAGTSAQPNGDFAFGAPTPPESKSVLHTATPLLDVGMLRLASTPYPKLMAKLYPAAPVWWTARGSLGAEGADLTLRAANGPQGQTALVRVSAERGIHFIVANRQPVRWLVDVSEALRVDFSQIRVSVPWSVTGLLDLSVGGLQIREVNALPGVGEGVVGELRAVDDGTYRYLCVKVAGAGWKRTASLQA